MIEEKNKKIFEQRISSKKYSQLKKYNIVRIFLTE